ncbi:MAG: GntR family transcriptional regulator [bacterium]
MIALENDRYLPKYIKVKNKIKALISEKNINSGEQIPSESQLANKYKVSRHTIRKAIDILVQEAVLEKKQGVGTFYQGKKSSRTGNIGFISISLHDYIFADILSAADNFLHDKNYQIILGNSQDDLKKEKEILMQLMDKNIDGLIIEPAQSALSSSNLNLLEEIARRNIPVLVLDSNYQSDFLNIVMVDDYQGGFLATNHLLEMGHQEIAMIYKASHNPALARLEGYKVAIKEAGLDLQEYLIRPYFYSEFNNQNKFENEIKDIVGQLLKNKKLTAIFTFNDQIAIIVQEILNQKAIKVPEDISIIGFDDSMLVQLNNISITSISHPKEKAGRKAAEIIIEQIEKNDETSVLKKVFQPFLCKRNSVKKLR